MAVRAIVAAVATLCLFGAARAEEAVHFADINLKMAVEEELWVTNPTPSDMVGLISLDAALRNINGLAGLEYATNLRVLHLEHNQISSITSLSGLTALEILVLNNNQISDLSPLSGLRALTDLDIHENAITSLSSLAGLSSLRYLNAHDNQISDISSLAGLSRLETAILRQNAIRDLSVLAGLTQLGTLYLEGNRIHDISALSSLCRLQNLNIQDNEVTDISPLLSLTSLKSLDVRDNPWSEETCTIYVPQIIANNPGLSILDNCGPFAVSISSTAGGSVVDPGEGQFTYQYGDDLILEAKAEPNFVFIGWSGTNPCSSNPTIISVHQDHTIRADFLCTAATIHVDDDAQGDPGPGDPRLGDPRENGSREHPFDGLQEAIDVATDGATIRVHGGTYRECIDFLGKRITVTGFDPQDANVSTWPIIAGVSGPVVSFIRGELQDSILAGVMITGGTGRLVGAVRCVGSSPTVRNCLIVGNRAIDSSGAIVYCSDSSAIFINCTIADNQAGTFAAAVSLINARVAILDSIVWGNAPREIQFDGEYMPSICYTTVAGGWPGQGNLGMDPMFVSRGRWADRDRPDVTVGPIDPRAVWISGDYHLQSRAGRWDSKAAAWVQDPATSPCIDAGDPTSPISGEPSPNGGVINMGAFGGTTEASRSLR